MVSLVFFQQFAKNISVDFNTRREKEKEKGEGGVDGLLSAFYAREGGVCLCVNKTDSFVFLKQFTKNA